MPAPCRCRPRPGYRGSRGGGVVVRHGEFAPEACYTLRTVEWVEVTADVQAFWNTGMNAARGPVFLAGLRIHGHI